MLSYHVHIDVLQERHEDEDMKPAGPDPMMMCMPCGEEPKAAPPDMSVHTIPLGEWRPCSATFPDHWVSETSVVGLDATAAFNGLEAKEKNYAYHLSRADWEGAKICLIQCSAESVPIFSLLQVRPV